MNPFKKTLFLCLFLTVFILAGCDLAGTKNQLPDVMPEDFNFVFNFGVNGKNQLDTVKGQFTKDMVLKPSITTELRLTEEEMKSIYSEMRRINILSYTENFNPGSNMKQTPFETYTMKVIINGKEKAIYWEDENASQTQKAVQLRELFKRIQEIIINKEEYKKLPPAGGGYD